METKALTRLSEKMPSLFEDFFKHGMSGLTMVVFGVV